MTDDRDDDLARRIAELAAPEHRDGFWADLRADLASSTNEGPANSTRYEWHADVDLVENDELSERRDRRAFPNRILAAAAAVVVVSALTAGIVSTVGDRDDADVVTEPTVTASPTTAAERGGPPRPEGEPIRRGIGRPVAIDPTGTFLYVAAPAPDGGFGCEGAPAEALYVERVDGDGSDRRLAVDPGLVDATGTALTAFSDVGEIALGPRCEGHGATVVTGTIAEDGTVADPTVLTVPDTELGRPVDGVVDLEFLRPGVLVAATRTEGGAGDDHRRLYQFPVGPSEATDLGQDRVVQVEVADGDLVTLTYDGELRVDGRTRATGIEPGAWLAVGAGWTVVTAADQTDAYRLDASDDVEVRTSAVGGWDPAVVAPASVVLTRLEGDGGAVVAVEIGSSEVIELVDGATGGFVVTPDGRRLFAARPGDDPAAPPALLEQPLGR